MSNPGRSGTHDKYDMRGLSLAAYSYEKDLPFWTEKILPYPSAVAKFYFLNMKRKQNENRSVQLCNPCPFRGCAVCVAGVQMDILKK